MRSFVLGLALIIGAAVPHTARSVELPRAQRVAENAAKKRQSDAQIKKLLIEESIAAYDGNCPCPYSRARNGSRCGKRSAYSREGGDAPLCYPEDVTPDMVQVYRDEHPDE